MLNMLMVVGDCVEYTQVDMNKLVLRGSKVQVVAQHVFRCDVRSFVNRCDGELLSRFEKCDLMWDITGNRLLSAHQRSTRRFTDQYSSQRQIRTY